MQSVASSPRQEEKTLSSSSCTNNTATGVNLLATMSTSPIKEFTMRNRIQQSIQFLGMILVILSFGILSNTASANTVSGNSKSSSKVTILADVMLKSGTKTVGCKWVKGGWNSGHNPNGTLYWFWDSKRAKICPNKNSSTGWVKVAGGITGRACYNPWSVKKPKSHIITGKVEMRPYFKATAKATEKVSVTDVCGSASASASASATATGNSRIKAQGNAKVKASAQAKATATATAKASIVCAAPKSPPQGSSCDIGLVKNAIGDCVTQTQTSDQDATIKDCKGPNYNSSQCVINQTNIQINANCSQVVFVNGDGNVISTETPVCVNNTPPSKVTYTATMSAQATANASATASCPPGSDSATATVTASASASATVTFTSTVSQQDADDRAAKAAHDKAVADANANAYAKASAQASVYCKTTPPPPPVDHAPQITCVYPAHVYVKGNVQIDCEASDSDNDTLSVNGVSNNLTVGHVSGVTPTPIRYDKSQCPSTLSCYKSTFWADNTGTASLTYTVTANGKSAKSDGAFPVLPDDFGSLAAPSSDPTIKV